MIIDKHDMKTTPPSRHTVVLAGEVRTEICSVLAGFWGLRQNVGRDAGRAIVKIKDKF